MATGSRTLLTRSDRWFRYWMPYVFQKLPYGKFKHVYLPLNRNYKPLGLTSRDHVDYVKYVDQAVAFSGDPATFKGIWIDGDVAGKFYLYTDSPSSRRDYFERLGELISKPSRLVGMVEEDD